MTTFDCQPQGCMDGRSGCGACMLEGHNGLNGSLLLWRLAGKTRDMSWQQLPGATRLVTADGCGVKWLHVAVGQLFLVGEAEV